MNLKPKSRVFPVLYLLAFVLLLGSCSTPRASVATNTAPMSAADTPTVAPAVPTDTPEPPTKTPVPPTDTPVPPADTVVPPTNTPAPPTDTPAPPTDTPVPPTPTDVPVAELDAESLVQERCSECHSLTRVEQSNKNEEQWSATVKRMVGKGANLSPDEQAAVIIFLAEMYVAAPALDALALIQDRCTVCHTLSRVEQASKSDEQWAATIERMIGKGAKLTAEEQLAVVEYLAKAYP
jgi:hypothetical protein